MRTSSYFIATALALLTLAPAPTTALAQRPDSALVGTWTGSATITVPWTAQRQLAIRIIVAEDGKVTGNIGDAQLVGARLFSDRTALARALGLGRNYVVEGDLSGAIIRSEGVARSSVRMPLDLSGAELRGELQTSGSYEGPTSGLSLTASGIVLRKSGPIISLDRRSVTSPR
jgi:hypothetical protein